MKSKTECTLLELVRNVGESTANDDEVVATIAYLINSGRVRLRGNFAGARVAMRPSLNGFLRWVRTPEPRLAV
jgi:hypothetical protein